jgi:hypothetical protein
MATEKGNMFRVVAIWKIIKNLIYIGKIRFNKHKYWREAANPEENTPTPMILKASPLFCLNHCAIRVSGIRVIEPCPNNRNNRNSYPHLHKDNINHRLLNMIDI